MESFLHRSFLLAGGFCPVTVRQVPECAIRMPVPLCVRACVFLLYRPGLFRDLRVFFRPARGRSHGEPTGQAVSGILGLCRTGRVFAQGTLPIQARKKTSPFFSVRSSERFFLPDDSVPAPGLLSGCRFHFCLNEREGREAIWSQSFPAFNPLKAGWPVG